MRALFARGAFGVDAATSPRRSGRLRRGASRLRAAALRRALVLCARRYRDARARHRNRVAANIAMKFALVMGLNFGVVVSRSALRRRLGQILRARLSRAPALGSCRDARAQAGILPVLAAALAAGGGFFAGDAWGIVSLVRAWPSRRCCLPHRRRLRCPCLRAGRLGFRAVFRSEARSCIRLSLRWKCPKPCASGCSRCKAACGRALGGRRPDAPDAPLHWRSR